jgi:DNA modification methylase
LTIPYFRPNTIYCGDCKEVLAKFPDKCAHLIYIDPPFFSNRKYEIIWKDGYEIRAFEDRWKGGMDNYIVWMEERLRECHRVLKSTGTLYLHCDWKAVHHLKVMLDTVFERRNFRNEIIWNHQILGQAHSRAFPKAHEHLLRYSKTDEFVFNVDDPSLRLPYSDYILNNLEKDEKGVYYTRRRATRKVTAEEKARGAYLKTYIDVSKGRLMGDVWTDLPYYQPKGKEKLGYPTQKPEALLERIIKSSSNPTDLVLDPMCGCGTAIVVAQRVGRQWVGIDVSPTACKLMANRMKKLGVSPNLMGMPFSEQDLRKLPPFEFQNWVVQRLFGRVSARKSSDMGIDGTTFEGHPIQVKQSDDVGRNVIDNFETAIRRRKQTKGTIVAFSFGKGAYEEIARAKLHDNTDIQAMTVQELLKNQEQDKL